MLFAICYPLILALLIYADTGSAKLTSSDAEEKFGAIFQIGIVVLPFLLLIIHVLRIFRLPYGLSIQTLGVFHKRKICLNLQNEQAFDLAIKAIRNDEKSWCESKDLDNGKITAYRYEDSIIGMSIIVIELTAVIRTGYKLIFAAIWDSAEVRFKGNLRVFHNYDYLFF